VHDGLAIAYLRIPGTKLSLGAVVVCAHQKGVDVSRSWNMAVVEPPPLLDNG
jgi:hypothetical protein